ncbi:MAG TPA: pyruvate dehydrogenase (acetyl-transferring) E1 component subunit alpha [Steroidobacteraceae bacterium]|nr:pyruvate dehydrogenase (acetyl-transferring) E1 component subunit alpha [Steroidobacteraceae bacterium]
MEKSRVSAQFEIPYFQLLSPEGTVAAHAPPLDRELLLAMYKEMVRTRTFDTKAVNLQRTGKLGTYPSCLGHEATHVAVGAAMRAEDVLFTVYREVGTKFWRGVPMTDILLYWGGDERGTMYQKNKEDFPFCVPIASQMPQAAGCAMAFSIRKQPRCAVAFIGDGGTSQGAFYEAINLAGARNLPLVTLVVNNGWAISVPLSEQTGAKTLAQKAIAAGVTGVQADGNDVLAMYHLTREALERARSGGGPTVIEALTYRLGDHTTADDATRYRQASEVEAARRIEPLLRTRALLEAEGLWSEAAEQALRAAASAEVEDAVKAYLATPRQSSDAMFDHLFAELPRNLQSQREQARHYAGRH